MITLTRQSIKSRKLEEKALKATGGRDPDITFKNPSESKGGVFETYIRVICYFQYWVRSELNR